MKEVACIKSDLNEENSMEYLSDSEFQDQYENEMVGSRTSESVKPEDSDESLHAASASSIGQFVATDEQLSSVQRDSSNVDKYTCSVCGFKPRKKYDIKKHVLTHVNNSDVELHKCSLCNFSSRYKKSLARHVQTHADPFEDESKDAANTTIYSCHLCSYKTYAKGYLKRHIKSNHKYSSEIYWFQCDTCNFKSKYKQCFNRHKQLHVK